ncbi:MAG: aldo/keto reductase [Negativicutes bacterium]
MAIKCTNIQLGLGLTAIGRKWGYKSSTVPDEATVLRFLREAYVSGIKFFDTAPAYGSSETRFGKFLKTLSKEQRQGIIVATKFGEFFDDETLSTYIDHSEAALCGSVDKSIEKLGTIDILQLHKTSPAVLSSKDLFNAMQYARQRGIRVFGASISDVESGRIVCEGDIFSVIQFPYNMSSDYLEEIMYLAKKRNKFVIVNRPFNNGEIMYKNGEQTKSRLMAEAFRFIVNKGFNGVILTGTKSGDHLQENIKEFQKVLKE